MQFESDLNEYYILATGRDSDAFENESIGRVMVFQVTPDRKLRLVSQIKTEGMAEYVRPFQGKLITSIEGMVRKEFKSDTK
jgi:DNA damage-binding protein 1